MSRDNAYKTTLLKEIAKCRACRFCVDVCPTYQASAGVETLSSFGRLLIIKYLMMGDLEFDDSLSYALYSCLQCKRCENICKSKGQQLEICQMIHLGRNLLSRQLIKKRNNGKL